MIHPPYFPSITYCVDICYFHILIFSLPFLDWIHSVLRKGNEEEKLVNMLSSTFPSLIHSLKCFIINITRYTSSPKKKKNFLSDFPPFFQKTRHKTASFISSFIFTIYQHSFSFLLTCPYTYLFLYNIHNKKTFFLLFHNIQLYSFAT